MSLLLALALPSIASAQSLLSGTPIGSPSVDYSTGSISETVNTPANAFDNNSGTFYASYDRSYTWVGLDLGQNKFVANTFCKQGLPAQF